MIQDRGMECDDKQYRHDPVFDEIRRNVITRGWQQFVIVTAESNTSLSLEFLANWPERENNQVWVRGKKIPITAEIINYMYNVPDYADEDEQLLVEEQAGINWAHFLHVLGFPNYHIHDNRIMLTN